MEGRDKVATEALRNATIDMSKPTEFTATLAPGKCARIECSDKSTVLLVVQITDE
jgi:hypothetical protein